MKSKHKIIMVICILILIICIYYFSDNSYKNRLMSKIKDANIVVLSNGNGDTEIIHFKKEIHPYVIFLNIIEVDSHGIQFLKIILKYL